MTLLMPRFITVTVHPFTLEQVGRQIKLNVFLIESMRLFYESKIGTPTEIVMNSGKIHYVTEDMDKIYRLMNPSPYGGPMDVD